MVINKKRMKNYIIIADGPHLRVEPAAVKEQIKEHLQPGQWVEVDEIPPNLAELTVIDGALAPAPEEILTIRRRMAQEAAMWHERDELLRQLKRSDYKAIKFAEGEITPEDYAPIRIARATARARINEIERFIEGR